MSEPARKKTAPLTRLSSPEDLAAERFGKIEGLAIAANTTLELAAYYADRFKLSMDDPEVAVTASALAFTRHKELLLLQQIEEDLYRRTMRDPEGVDYAATLFRVTSSGAHRDVLKEVDRLHSRARSYSKELRQLAREAAEEEA